MLHIKALHSQSFESLRAEWPKSQHCKYCLPSKRKATGWHTLMMIFSSLVLGFLASFFTRNITNFLDFWSVFPLLPKDLGFRQQKTFSFWLFSLPFTEKNTEKRSGQEPNRNQKPEPSNLLRSKAGPKLPAQFFRKRIRIRASLFPQI